MPAELVGFAVRTLGPGKVVGKELRTSLNSPEGISIPAFWSQCFQDGTIATLRGLQGRRFPSTLVGWVGRHDPADDSYSYVVGVLASPDAAIPEGMVSYDLPDTQFAVGSVLGTEPDIYAHAHDQTPVEAAKAGLRPAHSFVMEWYDERFEQPDGRRLIDLYIPVQ